MQHTDLLVAFGAETSLASFANIFFLAIGVSVFEERQSENYVDGRYFKGSNDCLVFRISLSDEGEPEVFPYWINVAASMPAQDDLIEIVNRLVQEGLLPAGFRATRIENFGKLNEGRVEY